MTRLLHIVTHADDTLSREVIARQQQAGENQVEVVDLTSGKPDYNALVEKIFAADSVAVW